MAKFDPIKEGARPVFDPVAEGATPAANKSWVEGVPILRDIAHTANVVTAPVNMMDEYVKYHLGGLLGNKGIQQEAGQEYGQRKQSAEEALSHFGFSSDKDAGKQPGNVGQFNPGEYAKGTSKAAAAISTLFQPMGETGWLSRLVTGGIRGAEAGYSDPNATAGSTAESAAGGATAEVLLPALFNLLKKGGSRAGTIIKSPTYGKTAKWAEDIAEKGTQEGKSLSWGDYEDKVRQRVLDKMENTQAVKDATEKFLSERAPASTEGLPEPGGDLSLSDATLDPTEVLKRRRALTDAYGSKNFFSNVLDKLLGKSPAAQSTEDKIAFHARNVLSEELKNMVPDIKQPDALFSFYKRIKGDVPTWGKKILVEEVLRRWIEHTFGHTAGKTTTPIVSGVTGL